jgi:hypothetical protein
MLEGVFMNVLELSIQVFNENFERSEVSKFSKIEEFESFEKSCSCRIQLTLMAQ